MICPFAFVIENEAELDLFVDFVKRYNLSPTGVDWATQYKNYTYRPLPAVLGLIAPNRTWHNPLARYNSIEHLQKTFPNMPPLLNTDILYNPDNYPELFI